MFIKMEVALIDQWKKKVLLSSNNFHVQCSTIKEDLFYISVNYCFLDNFRNINLLCNNENKFLTAITSNPTLCKMFFTFASN